MKPYHYPGNIYIISAPSGTGKSTLLARITERDDKLRFSVSHTTRAPRSGEADGVHYYFVSKARFEVMIQEGAFLEWAEVHGNYYGTSSAHIEKDLEQGLDVILDIDVAGARQVKEKLPSATSIFILPPDFEKLEHRLIERGKDSPETIRKRLHGSLPEVRQAKDFDYLLINDDLDTCTSQLEGIIASDRHRFFRVRGRADAIIKSFERQA